jgi:2-methylisocitrate lyase-like PEP mutase family enzyme
VPIICADHRVPRAPAEQCRPYGRGVTANTDAFRRLHRSGDPLLLPNAWDFASAAALAGAGHRAIGTTSLGVAAAAGKPDATAATRAETVTLTRALSRLLSRLPCLLTVDIEAGFNDEPTAVADLAAELAEAGAVGVNVEDGRTDGTLDDPERHSAKVAAIKDRVPDLFVNARTDTFWLADGDQADTLRRAAAYVAAGADGVFVPGAADPSTIRTLAAEIAVPLNVLYSPGKHTVAGLAGLGVARVSTGSLLFRVALGAAVATIGAVERGEYRADPATPSYADIQRLLS